MKDAAQGVEGIDAAGAVPESVEVAGFALFAAVPALAASRRFRDRVLGLVGFHDAQIAPVESAGVFGR